MSEAERQSQSGSRITLRLTAMAQGGEALGRDESGRVVFVPYAMAGEEVLAEITEEKKGYARARVVEILQPAPDRIVPRCPHFGPRETVISTNPKEGYARGCGSCQWQHVAYEAQLRFKAEIVREQLVRIGKLTNPPVRPALGMREPWDYRNNVQFDLDAEGRLCFRGWTSHNLVPIRECYIQHPIVYSLFKATELEGSPYKGVTLRAGTRTGEKMIILQGLDPEPPEITVDEPVSIVYQMPDGAMVPLVGKDALHEELHGRTYRISPGSFFQVNTEMAERLIDLVQEFLAPRPEDVVLDAFGGVGTFGLALAPKVARVIEVESSPSAVEDARANAVEFPQVEFHRGPVEEVLPKLKAHVDLAVADPPRAGIDRRALDALLALAPRAFVYVSCDPATLARDARILVEGGYRLVTVQPVDMFPQTFHIESVSVFERMKDEG